MNVARRINNYYKQRMYGTRTIIARALDFVALRLAVFGAAYILLLFIFRDRNFALGFSIILVLILSVVLKIVADVRLERFVKKDAVKLGKDVLLERLILCPQKEFDRFVRQVCKSLGYRKLRRQDGWFYACRGEDTVYIKPIRRHPSEKCTVQEVLGVLLEARRLEKARALVLTTAAFVPEVDALCEKVDFIRVDLLDGSKLIDAAGDAGLLPAGEEIDAMILQELERRKTVSEKIKKAALSPLKFKRYLACGSMLAGAGVFFGFSIYYFIFSGLCFALAAISLILARKRKQASGD